LIGVPRVLVLIAAMNEEEGIGFTLSELKEVLDYSSFLVVDGNSTDGTAKIAEALDAKVLIQKGKGKGDAVAQAIRHIDGEIEYVVLLDADFTYPAGYLPHMIKVLEEKPEVGMVCGNRFNDSLHLGELHNLLYFGNRLLAFIHNFMNGIELHDPLTGMRVIRWKLLKDWRPLSKGFDVEVELNHWIERKGYDILEIPIPYRPRLGQKKLRLRHGFTILKRIVTETF
jgi:glycosyltransferase involved in cell wall biosynthesis